MSNDARHILTVEKPELKSAIQLPCRVQARVGVRYLVFMVNVRVRDSPQSGKVVCVCVLVNTALCGPKYVFSQKSDDILAGPHFFLTTLSLKFRVKASV